MSVTVGIDFGTTNSAIARVSRAGVPTSSGADPMGIGTDMAQFAHAGGHSDVYRSVLYFEHYKTQPPRTVGWTGPVAVQHYLAADTKGRLIQSLKSFLASRSLTATDIFGRRYTIEALIARLLRDLRTGAEAHFGTTIGAAVVGRPVHFVGAESDHDSAFAEGRLREALAQAGFEQVTFEYEPVAAAYFYESTLHHEELILIGDFGGGTSDFTMIEVGPRARARRTAAASGAPRECGILGNAGVGLAGDAFDARIIRHLVSPALGAGGEMRSFDRLLPVPISVYSKLERWHYLSLLRNRDTLGQLERVRQQALEPSKIAALIHLIASDLGYQLHGAVQALKCALSRDEHARFHFTDDVLTIDAVVTRSQFESWIVEELGQIEVCVDGLLRSTGVAAVDVDRVFLTGGTSLVPAVRHIFETRFGSGKIRTGAEFTSVARGLAMRGATSQ